MDRRQLTRSLLPKPPKHNRQKAIEFCKPGRSYKDIGGIIEEHVTKAGYTTVREFCGHGVGKVFHTTPNVLHFKYVRVCVVNSLVDLIGVLSG